MQSYLVEMINERKLSDEKDERMDLLSNFVDANDELLEDGEQKLGEVELIGRGSCRGLLVHSFTPGIQETFSYSTSLDMR